MVHAAGAQQGGKGRGGSPDDLLGHLQWSWVGLTQEPAEELLRVKKAENLGAKGPGEACSQGPLLSLVLYRKRRVPGLTRVD